MSVYVMGQLNFRSIDHYRRYQAQFPAVFSASNGKALCADESPKTLEGDIRVDKIVLLEFPTEEDAMSFLESDAYQEIAKDRKTGATGPVFLARGLQPSASAN